MANTLIFTTSWDDGSVHDLKLAELLERCGIKGTFYIPKHFNQTADKFAHYQRRLNEGEVRQLARRQEIGAHTMQHVDLVSLELAQARDEIINSKKWLERVIGQPVEMFAYPYGRCNAELAACLRTAGFSGGRTTRKLAERLAGEDRYLLPVSVQSAPFPFRKVGEQGYYWRRLLDPVAGYGWELLRFPALLGNVRSWQALARGFLKISRRHGGYFHLYGHSWELEHYNFWGELEKFLRYASSQSSTCFLTNSETVELLPL